MRDFADENTLPGTNQLLVWWDVLRTGLWPIPLGMSVAALVLFNGALIADGVGLDEPSLRRWHLYSGTGEDARNLLSTLAAAIITMSSVVFSITVVALSLAANQFGSRLVRTHMTDIRTKLALGLFTMTIIYCLTALRSVDKQMPAAEVPHITVSLGLLLALVCVLALLFFLHFIARSIVADEVIRRVAGELQDSIAQLPALDPDHATTEISANLLPLDFHDRCTILRSRVEGYIEAIGYERLAALCSEHDLYVRLDLRAGAFICKEGWLAFVYPKEALTPTIAGALADQILIGEQRTPTQDIEFTLRHLVDIALRALSPGINDANTALVVIDHLSAALSGVMKRALPSGVHRDDVGAVRVVAKTSSYSGVLAAALHQIRQSAEKQPAVIIELLRAMGRIGEQVRLAEQRDALLHQVELISAAGLRAVQEPADRADIDKMFSSTQTKLLQMRLR